jgi:hypothetical protein
MTAETATSATAPSQPILLPTGAAFDETLALAFDIGPPAPLDPRDITSGIGRE